MYSHNEIDISDKDGIILWGEIFNGNEKLELMQVTGLLDKNGKEIYEGDIVRDGSEIFAVQWVADTGAWGILDSDESMAWLGDYNISCEIIGNIYENPELLKEA